MRLSDDFIYELRSRNEIESVVSSYVNLKRQGSLRVGLCPFHNEKTPSFTVYTENGSYYCFGCNAGGDVITFIRSIEHLDYLEAVKFLADRAGMKMPEHDLDDSLHKLKPTIYAINKETARFYHQMLSRPEGAPGLQYLRGRALSDATIRRFGLGFAPGGWTALFEHLTRLGFSPEDIQQADLIRKGGRGGYYDRFMGRVMFPIIDLRGNVIGFGGRILPGDPHAEKSAKYINSGDTPVYKKSRNIYALNVAKNAPTDSLILTEGYMDTIALHQAGFPNAVAALGTAFTPEQAKLLSRYCKEVVVTLDADEAGQRATRRAMEILSTTGLSVRVLKIPDGKDPDEYIKTHGPQRFKALLEGAANDVEFRLAEIRARYDIQSPSGKIGYLSEAVAFLATLDSEITIDIYAGRISEECGVSRSAVDSQLTSGRKKLLQTRQKKRFSEATQIRRMDRLDPVTGENLRAHRAQEKFLSLLMHYPDLYEKARALAPESMISELHRRIYEALLEILSKGYEFQVSLLADKFSPEEMGRIVRLQNSPVSRQNAENELNDCIRVILEEKDKLSGKTAEIDDEAFLQRMSKLREQKTKENIG